MGCCFFAPCLLGLGLGCAKASSTATQDPNSLFLSTPHNAHSTLYFSLRSGAAYDEDEDGGAGGGQRVQCAQQ